jgi:HlyD family secretion protein
MKKILIFTGLAVLLVGLPLISKITGGRDATEVEIQQAELKPIKSSILASGTLAFREQVQLRSEVIGQVVELHVEEADPVNKGDMVITLDPESYQAQVDQRRAQVRMQRIAIERQEVMIANLEERYQRQKTLFDSQLVDEDSFELLGNQLDLARVDLRSFEESLAQAQAALNQSEELLDKTRIRSPIDGIVIQIVVKVGETVIAGTTNIPGSTMMVFADRSETLTEVQVDEADIAQVTEGQRADVYPAAHPDTPLAGSVQSIASVARQAQGQQSLTSLVKILLDEQDEIRIRPGMSVRADIYTETSDETISVPVQAVQYEDEIGLDEDNDNARGAEEEKAYVFVFADGKAIRRDVKTGISSDSDQQILEGLEKGEKVIIGPYRELRNLADGDLVKEADPSDKDDEEDD